MLPQYVGKLADKLQKELGKPLRTFYTKTTLRSMRAKMNPVLLSIWEWGEGKGQAFRPTRRVRLLLVNGRTECDLRVVFDRL